MTYELLKKNFPFPYGDYKPVASSLAEPQDMSRVRARNALKVRRFANASETALINVSPDLARHFFAIRPAAYAEQHVGSAKDAASSIEGDTFSIGAKGQCPAKEARTLPHKRHCTPLSCCISY